MLEGVWFLLNKNWNNADKCKMVLKYFHNSIKYMLQLSFNLITNLLTALDLIEYTTKL